MGMFDYVVVHDWVTFQGPINDRFIYWFEVKRGSGKLDLVLESLSRETGSRVETFYSRTLNPNEKEPVIPAEVLADAREQAQKLSEGCR